MGLILGMPKKKGKIHCVPCDIPRKNLTFTFVSVQYGTISQLMTWNGVTWTYPRPFFRTVNCECLEITIGCFGQGSLGMVLDQYGQCTESIGGIPTDYTCSPFHLHVAGPETGGGCNCLITVTDLYLDE